MRFIYGKQDFRTLERGEESCYLMTNGLGGFSSLTLTGSAGRNDHAVLMACMHSPNHRYNMVHRLEELLCVGGEQVHISSQSYKDRERDEEGFRFQTGFVYEDYPQWTYLVNGVEITRTIVLGQGENIVGISYEIRNRSGSEAELLVLPHLIFKPKGELLLDTQKFTVDETKISSGGQKLYYQTDGEFTELPLYFCRDLYYASDACDGRRETGCTAVNHQIGKKVPAGETAVLTILYGTVSRFSSVEEMCGEIRGYRESLRRQAGFEDKVAQVLSVSANQFISYRSSTAGQTILAGFPFFEDWGRDTMIALGGCCLAVRQYKTAERILKTFMSYCKKGLMPNLFPEGKEAPGYNTVDASLLFILAVYEYYKKTKDLVFVKSAYPTMTEIVDWYMKGTDYGIRMDEDGLITAGQELDQVTWMDVRVGDILPTPRHGKPVEINAYWYNVLCIMKEFGRFFPEDVRDYTGLADKVRESFQKFWNEDKGCLKDVLSVTMADSQADSQTNSQVDSQAGSRTDSRADCQIRCNQIWAVSLPFSVLSEEQERQVVETVFRELYTPCGLRTLNRADQEFHPFYGGSQLERDLAYHQGTVWVFPLGAYYLAYLKVNHNTKEARSYVRKQLEVMEAALREGCIGQLPEIYDGENPVNSKGCFAQAWSVGEILRVYDALREEVPCTEG